MAKVYKTAMGKVVDIDRLRLANEETIAVGNMRVNARGDELGHGGRVVKSRNEVMNDYYRLKTPVATPQHVPEPDETKLQAEAQAVESQRNRTVRGSLADSVLKNKQRMLEDPEGEQ